MTTDEVAARLDDPELRILDVDEDTEAYGRGHLRNAQGVNWRSYGNADVTPDARVVAYCRIGERSAPTWFVLHELLGYHDVRNYDGSWTEWGSMVVVPVER